MLLAAGFGPINDAYNLKNEGTPNSTCYVVHLGQRDTVSLELPDVRLNVRFGRFCVLEK